MASRRFEKWASKFAQTLQLSTLGAQDSRIGVDASYYLNQCLNDSRDEPLKVALGGVPFTSTARIEEDLQAAKEAGIDLIFIFDGLDFVTKNSGDDTINNQRAYTSGWNHYLQGDPTKTVADFGKAEYPLTLVYRHLRKLVHDNGFKSMIAPFSSVAWLAYLYHLQDPIDAIMASPDAFLFGVDKVILNIDSKSRSFSWVTKTECQKQVGNPMPPMFQDAQLMLGSQFLQPFPILQRNSEATIKDALGLMSRGTPLSLCAQFREDPAVPEWADKYKRAVLTIRHHVVIMQDGSVQPTDAMHATGDVHEFVGQRLPDELFFYISRGLIDPQVPNWLAKGEITLTLPGGALDTESFSRFVYDNLNPIRLQCLKLLAESLHFYYQAKVINSSLWDGRSDKRTLKEVPALKDKVSSWKVTTSALPALKDKKPTLLFCLRALMEGDTASKTITKGRVEHPALRSQNEILANTYWRFLHIRGYLDDKHQLTTWGRMLAAALGSMDANTSEDQVLVVVELLRLNMLSTRSPVGVEVSNTDKAADHKRYTNLLSKIACLGRLKHETIGYVGPIDRGLLTFAWQVTYLRELLRDLMETVMVTMFLNGDVDRNRKDWLDLPQMLPLVSDQGSSLGITVKTYLDALNDRHESGASLDELKKKIKAQEKPFDWFLKAEDGSINKSLDVAFELFDCVLAAVKAGEKEVKDASTFTSANDWLSTRR